MYIYVCVYVCIEHMMGIKMSAPAEKATACCMLVCMYVPIK